jgi:hypothetical protein
MKRAEGRQRALVRGDGREQVPFVHVASEGLCKLPPIVGVARDVGDGVANAGGAHLERIGDRQRRLLFQRIDPAVPKLRLVIERVQNSRRIALTGASGDAD